MNKTKHHIMQPSWLCTINMIKDFLQGRSQEQSVKKVAFLFKRRLARGTLTDTLFKATVKSHLGLFLGVINTQKLLSHRTTLASMK